jgi:hypothetical protein
MVFTFWMTYVNGNHKSILFSHYQSITISYHLFGVLWSQHSLEHSCNRVFTSLCSSWVVFENMLQVCGLQFGGWVEGRYFSMYKDFPP